MSEIRFDGRVAIVTGAGAGLGRSHALGLAARGASVVVNDLGAATDGTGQGSDAARAVVSEIREAGGHAIANGANVADEEQVQAMVDAAIAEFGHVDILVNNAGILRDKTFAKMSLDDFQTVLDVHLMGAVHCTHALWRHMTERQYGRIVFTTSASGLYGNFGQSNYGAAKAAMLGLMNVLHHEGHRKNVRVNILAPTAATRMTEALLPPEVLPLLAPETITPGLLALVAENAPSKMILGAGGGCFAETKIYETRASPCPIPISRPKRWWPTWPGSATRRVRRKCPGRSIRPTNTSRWPRICAAFRLTQRTDTMRDALIVSTARTPIGKAYRGAFNATSAQTLIGHAVSNAVSRAGLDGGEVADCIVGAALQQGSTGGNIGVRRRSAPGFR